MIKWMESGTLFQTKPWLGELPTSSPSVSNMAGQSRNKMEVSCCETWKDGPESHGWLPEGIHAYPFWGVQESQATRLILDASLLCLSKVSGHRKKMMELQYNSFPQQIKIPPSNPSLGGGPCEKSGPSRFEAPAPSFAYLRSAPGPNGDTTGYPAFTAILAGKGSSTGFLGLIWLMFRWRSGDFDGALGWFWAEIHLTLHPKKGQNQRCPKSESLPLIN